MSSRKADGEQTKVKEQSWTSRYEQEEEEEGEEAEADSEKDDMAHP